MSELDDNKALLRRYLEEFFNERALDRAADVRATDYTEHALAPFGDVEPGAVDGPEHLRRTVAWLTDQYPDLHMDVEAIVAEGDLVVARILWMGTYTGGTHVVRSTGKSFSSEQTSRQKPDRARPSHATLRSSSGSLRP
jgi:predicted SnoaL-like aldol condensation-catalyzing enzyme